MGKTVGRSEKEECLGLVCKPKWISTWLLFDSSTKPVFDHLRNLGICILVFAVGSHVVLNEFTPLKFGDTGRFLVGTVLMLLAIALFVKNAASLLLEAWRQVSTNRKETAYFVVDTVVLDTLIRLSEVAFIVAVYLVVVYPFLTSRLGAMLKDSPGYVEWLRVLKAMDGAMQAFDNAMKAGGK